MYNSSLGCSVLLAGLLARWLLLAVVVVYVNHGLVGQFSRGEYSTGVFPYRFSRPGRRKGCSGSRSTRAIEGYADNQLCLSLISSCSLFSFPRACSPFQLKTHPGNEVNHNPTGKLVHVFYSSYF